MRSRQLWCRLSLPVYLTSRQVRYARRCIKLKLSTRVDGSARTCAASCSQPVMQPYLCIVGIAFIRPVCKNHVSTAVVSRRAPRWADGAAARRLPTATTSSAYPGPSARYRLCRHKSFVQSEWNMCPLNRDVAALPVMRTVWCQHRTLTVSELFRNTPPVRRMLLLLLKVGVVLKCNHNFSIRCSQLTSVCISASLYAVAKAVELPLSRHIFAISPAATYISVLWPYISFTLYGRVMSKQSMFL